MKGIFFKRLSLPQVERHSTRFRQASVSQQMKALEELRSVNEVSPERAEYLLHTITTPNQVVQLARLVLKGEFSRKPHILDEIVGQFDRYSLNIDVMDIFANAIDQGQFQHASQTTRFASDSIRCFPTSYAQLTILNALLTGKLGDKPGVQSTAMETLLELKNPRIMSRLAVEIQEGMVKCDKILTVVAKNLPAFTNRYDLQSLCRALELGHFGKREQTIRALILNLPVFNQRYMQVKIAAAISNKTLPLSFRHVSSFFDQLHFFTDYQAQTMIVEALLANVFGSNEYHHELFAEKCTFLTGYKAQAVFSHAVLNHRFGHEMGFYNKLALNLPVFTGVSAQRNLARAIEIGVFGGRFDTLEAVISHTRCFTDPTAQASLARKHLQFKGVHNEGFLLRMARESRHLTDFQAQWTLYANFSCIEWPRSVVLVFLQNLHGVKSVELHSVIVRRVSEGRFGRDPESVRALLEVPWMHHHLPQILPFLVRDVPADPAKSQALSQCKYDPDSFLQIQPCLERNADLLSFFGSTLYVLPQLQALLVPRMEASGIAAPAAILDDIFLEGEQYAVLVIQRDNQLILVKWCASRAEEAEIQQNQVLTEPQVRDRRAQFSGWVTCNEHVLYQSVTAQARVFVWSNGAGPTVFDANNIVITDPVMELLPPFLKCAVLDNHFNSQEYAHERVMNVLFEDVLPTVSTFSSVLASQLRSVFERAITVECAGLDLSLATLTEINEASTNFCLDYQARSGGDVFNLIRQAIASKNLGIIDLARLGFLCLQLSKAGVLGRHGGGTNFANELLYSLGKLCVFHIVERAPVLAVPLARVLANLRDGVCAQTVAQDFLNVMNGAPAPYTCNVREIFDKLQQ